MWEQTTQENIESSGRKKEGIPFSRNKYMRWLRRDRIRYMNVASFLEPCYEPYYLIYVA
ncbi:hypothetical protein Hanom_Chr07g00655091 [Helianthus anomalus]